MLNQSYAIGLLLAFSLCSCIKPTTIKQEPTQSAPKADISYGPRWIDYEGWGKLELGMTKQEVLQTMGEPYMVQDAIMQESSSLQTFIFKVRIKHYAIHDSHTEKKVIPSRDPQYSEEVSIVTNKDTKPDKFADSERWGDIFDLYCVFSNGKLAHYYCPELLNNYPERSQKSDSLVIRK